MNIKSNQSLKNITINLVPLIEDDVRNFFIEVENLNKESLVFYGPIRMTVKKIWKEQEIFFLFIENNFAILKK